LQRINIHEVAKRAKVSIATVSRAINGKPKVSNTVIRRVWRVIEEIGYYPNTHARTLVQGHSRTFGLMVSSTIARFYPEVLQGFADLGAEYNYDILLSPIPKDANRFGLVVRRLMERRVGGVAILSFAREKSLATIFERSNVPVIEIVTESSKASASTIKIDYEHGIRQAVQHLAALGHLRIAFIAGPANSKIASARKHAFRKCMREIALPSKLILEGDHTLESGITAMSTLARLTPRPSAVICSHDLTAVGVMRAARDLNIDIPKHLSVVGLDDIDAAQFTTPALTTVRTSQFEIANAAFHALLNATPTDGSSSSHDPFTIKTNLVLRDSTAIASCRIAATIGVTVRGSSTIASMTNKDFSNVV
jgi:DNA-binding LacI/PurR family transcriptional regulator